MLDFGFYERINSPHVFASDSAAIPDVQSHFARVFIFNHSANQSFNHYKKGVPLRVASSAHTPAGITRKAGIRYYR